MTTTPVRNSAQAQRLSFIEVCLVCFGRVNREPLMLYFGIAEAQASRDLSQYSELAPGNMVYDRSAKTYLKGLHFKRVLT